MVKRYEAVQQADHTWSVKDNESGGKLISPPGKTRPVAVSHKESAEAIITETTKHGNYRVGGTGG
jgi:hypothetical protein